MAFHPFRTFQKNRKFWMALMVLVSMATFVLCGLGQQGGDFASWLLGILRGHSGDEVVRIDGRAIYTSDLDQVRQQRDIANEYMRKASQLVMAEIQTNMEETGKAIKNDETRQKWLLCYGILQASVGDHLARQRYFDGGTKLDDLIDFMVWRNQADRLGINLTEDAVKDMVAEEVYNTRTMREVLLRVFGIANPQEYHLTMQRMTGWRPNAAAYVQREVRGAIFQANYSLILQALTDEFRVRLARLALEKSPTLTRQPTRNPRDLTGLELATTTRMPVPPAMIDGFFKDKRYEAEIALIPVDLERYLDDVPTPPEAEWRPALKVLFDKYRDRRYDPSKVEPGFQLPEHARIQWVTANPQSAFFKHVSHAATVLQQVPPILYNPMQSPFMTAAAYAAQSADADARLQQAYEKIRRLHPEKYEMPGLATYSMWPLFKGITQPKADQIAALAAGMVNPLYATPNAVSALASYQAMAYDAQIEELTPLLQFELKKRAPIGTTMLFSRPISPFLAAGLEFAASEAPQFVRDGGKNLIPMNWPYEEMHRLKSGQFVRASSVLPDNGRRVPPYRYMGFPPQNVMNPQPQPQPLYLPLVGPLKSPLKAEIQTTVEKDRAAKWAQSIMRTVKARLDAKTGGQALAEEVIALRKEYGGALTEGGSDGLQSPYTIGEASGMAPLKQSYDKYYEDVNRQIGPLSAAGSRLGPDDFSELFFSGQSFAVGTSELYTPKPWPPTIRRVPTPFEKMMKGKQAREETINLWKTIPDVQCFLFWKTDGRPMKAPDDLTEVLPEVKHAWKVEKARLAVGPRIKTLTDPLVAATKGDLWAAVRKQAQALGYKRATKLSHVAPLVKKEKAADPRSNTTIAVYEPYELPHGKILYPRDDAAKDILALRQLKEPIKTGLTNIDDLNRELFKATKASGKYIQILTNRPQTTFYIAVLVQPPVGSEIEFFAAYQRGYGRIPQDLFVQQCQSYFGQEYNRELLAQLRREYVKGEPSADVQKRYNQEGGQ